MFPPNLTSTDVERLKNKVHSYFPPPILCMNFRMVVVDETQRIESEGESKVLSMAKRIHSNFRLSVSGTPLGSDRISDLHSLCQFLRMPFANDWQAIYSQKKIPISIDAIFSWLNGVFHKVIVRRTKKQVERQLHLQKKMIITKKLKFSKFEMSLYEEREKSIVSSKKYDKADIELLRQGCCHPSVFDKKLAVDGKHVRNFGDIMIAKIEQLKITCEEHQRQIFFHLFLAAGMSIVESQCADSNQDLKFDGFKSDHYLKRALDIYLFVYHMIKKNRETCRLLSLIKLDGDSHYMTKDVTSTSESIVLQWEFNKDDLKNLSNKDQGMTMTDDEVEWTKLDNDISLSEFVNQNRASNIDLSDVTKQQIYCKMLLNTARRILGMSITISELKKIPLSTSPIMLLFPNEVNLMAAKGLLETFTSVFRHALPLPKLELRDNDLKFTTESVNEVVNSYRARSWKLLVESIHSTGLLLLKKDDGSLYGSWQSVKDFDSTNCIISFSVDWHEAAFDVDVFQVKFSILPRYYYYYDYTNY